eukprot:scaffold13882_cov31-Tisochrysis_lutea.AAC.8
MRRVVGSKIASVSSTPPVCTGQTGGLCSAMTRLLLRTTHSVVAQWRSRPPPRLDRALFREECGRQECSMSCLCPSRPWCFMPCDSPQKGPNSCYQMNPKCNPKKAGTCKE